MHRRIPYAVANYEEIVGGGYHFVDKTRFIRELEHYKVPVFLRPRRFGKSLWCSILEEDLHRAHPELTIVRHVAYTVSGAGSRLLAAG